MSRSINQDRLALLDGLVRYHAQKFVECERRRITLHAHSQNRPVPPAQRSGSVDRESVLAEIVSIENRLAQLRAGLQ